MADPRTPSEEAMEAARLLVGRLDIGRLWCERCRSWENECGCAPSIITITAEKRKTTLALTLDAFAQARESVAIERARAEIQRLRDENERLHAALMVGDSLRYDCETLLVSCAVQLPPGSEARVKAQEYLDAFDTAIAAKSSKGEDMLNTTNPLTEWRFKIAAGGNTVWIVYHSSYSPREVDSIWVSEKLADERRVQLGHNWHVEEWIVESEIRALP